MGLDVRAYLEKHAKNFPRYKIGDLKSTEEEFARVLQYFYCCVPNQRELDKYKETVQELQENNSKIFDECLYYRVNYNELKQQLIEQEKSYNNTMRYLNKIRSEFLNLPKKIVEEIKEWIKSQIIYCGGKANEVDILIANASNQVLEDLQNILNTILKKYGGEDE